MTDTTNDTWFLPEDLDAVEIDALSDAEWEARAAQVHETLKEDEAGAIDLCRKFAARGAHTPEEVLDALAEEKSAPAGAANYLRLAANIVTGFNDVNMLELFQDRPAAARVRGPRSNGSDSIFSAFRLS